MTLQLDRRLLSSRVDGPHCWPELTFESWKDTCATLHMWAQIVGKVRLRLTPLVNHWWNVPFYVTARGLTTSRMPYGDRSVEILFDFRRHELVMETNDGMVQTMALIPRSVADFYREFMRMLHAAGIEITIWRMPVEVPNPVPFDHDRIHASYDATAVERFWRILATVDSIFQEFRAEFIGKSSPVHFFWGSFDLAVTRFSGRRAPERPGADVITREAYSHEVSSVGYWPGSEAFPRAAFYCYAAPEPAGFGQAVVRPEKAFYHAQMSEFLLNYDDVRVAPSPTAALLDFCHSTYDAAADLGNWDRQALERAAG
ncbi:MAG TPA: DUF5996 family protein [Candidatus Binatia bacterium]|nr:DUF5996 family protein [Candidatus Binatia bacterium]